MRSRRFLPSISLLTAFDAVLRTGSTAAAARELALTQSTVSRLVQTLEGQLGCLLFERRRQRLVPTKAAADYGRDVTQILDRLQRASMRASASAVDGALTIAILPAFGTLWLAPRLGAFLSAHPGITVNLPTRLTPFDFERSGLDGAVHFGAADWRDAHHMKLFDERLTACVAPALLAAHPVSCASDVVALPLLRLETRRRAWPIWFAAHGCDAPAGTGMLFDQFATMTEAAVAGLGVALLPDFVAQAEIAGKRLVPLLQQSVLGSGAYWLVWPVSGASSPSFAAFRDWLAAETT